MKTLTKVTALFSLSLLLAPESFSAPSPAFEGRKLYLSNCMICHGADGKGNGPLAQKLGIDPEDLTSYTPSHSDISLQRAVAGDTRVASSKPSGHTDISKHMPKWGSILDTDQLSALIAYLRYLSTTEHALPGDPELGHALYKKYCATCHGKDGDGNGAMSKLIGITPIDHTNPRKTENMDNQMLAKSILEGKGNYMPAWRGILANNEIDALVSYIRLLSQTWGQLEHGGFVIVINPSTSNSEESVARDLLQDPTCSSASNLSKTGKAQAIKLGKLFKSRDISIQKVISGKDCLARETANIAFGKTETVDYITADEQVTEEISDLNLSKLEQRIGSYSGKDNLVVLAPQSTLDALSFLRVERGHFLVLMPMGKSRYDAVGAYKLNY
jgi:mono/diheme cytochrome c family protein